jgi:hypothetical protein
LETQLTGKAHVWLACAEATANIAVMATAKIAIERAIEYLRKGRRENVDKNKYSL